ncbi:MAG: DUF2723 domain-containing protein [Candidatus Eisenbacteria bacterium]|nr:DUF2723 domain-containing protein [Candidatus Eisenbacteria bacterium]
MSVELPPLTPKAGVAILILTAAFLALYLWGSAPSVMEGDSAELQTVALVGGIAHPSGYPLFIMAGNLFRHTLSGDLAHRITAMCAFFGALTIAVYVLVLRQVGLPFWSCLLGAAWYGTTYTFWWSSIRTEVYTLALLCFAIAMLKSLTYLRTRNPRDAAMTAFALGLTLAGHLAFCPAVLVIAATLIILRPGHMSFIGYLLLLFLPFVIGVSPYLYLFWADARHLPMNYLNYTINLDARQYGLSTAAFDDFWERIPWLVFGKESHPNVFLFSPRMLARNLLSAGAVEFLFEFGLPAFIPFILGIVKYKAFKKTAALLLLAIALSTVGLGIAFAYGRMLPVFLMAATFVVGIVLAHGIAVLVAAARRHLHAPKSLAIAFGSLFLVAGMLTPHILRVSTYYSYLGPLDWYVREEGQPTIDNVIPRLRHYWEPREYGNRVMSIVPKNALVAGAWDDIMILFYLHYAEGVRPDLTLDSFYREHLTRLAGWQKTYGLGERPVVLTSPPSILLDRPVQADSMAVTAGKWIYILKEPIRTAD